MNFEESVKYLYSLGNEVSAMKLGLENPRKLFESLGNPQTKYLKVQVAGTNGKGSACAFLDSICRHAGIKTGLYTSPHLISITERIKIDGKDISQEDFARFATIVRNVVENSGIENQANETANLIEGTQNQAGTTQNQAGTSANQISRTPNQVRGTQNQSAGSENQTTGNENQSTNTPNQVTGSKNLIMTTPNQIPATFFEQMTAIALLAFAENKVDLAILETGLGGRLDATTAANAEIVAITPIDYDHQQYLGETLEEIAGEKAAIINSSKQKVVISKQKPEAEKVILERCEKFEITPISNSEFQISDFKLSLLGNHQIENAQVSVCIAELLQIDKQNIIRGLETATHKGRLEFYRGILFDGAHNIAGARALREYLQESHQNSKIALIFGAMKDKQIAEIAEILFPLAEDLILTQPNNSRAATVEELSGIAKKIVVENKILTLPNIADAIDLARQLSASYPTTSRSLICVTGSLYLIGEAQKNLDEK